MAYNYGSKSNVSSRNDNWRCLNSGIIPKLTYVLNREQFTDVSFTFPKEERKSIVVLKAHKFMLSLSSPVFEAMFNGQFEESRKSPGEPILITDIQSDAFKSMLHFIYTGELPSGMSYAHGYSSDYEHILQTMYAANKYCISDLQKACSDLIVRKITTKNVISIFQNVQLLDDKNILDKAKAYIQRHFEGLLNCKEFLDFSYDNLCLLLTDPKTCVDPDNEILLFRSLMKWTEAECHRQKRAITPLNKRAILGKITNLIQFSKMKPSDVSHDVFNSNILDKDEMLLLFRHVSVFPDNTYGLPKLPFTVINRHRK